MRVKKPKKPEKSARENEILRVKKTKNGQKKAFTPTFFFTPKKKNNEFQDLLRAGGVLCFEAVLLSFGVSPQSKAICKNKPASLKAHL